MKHSTLLEEHWPEIKESNGFSQGCDKIILTRVVELESVESHVFSWSRSRESVFKTAGVGSRFSKLLESESAVGVGSWFSKLLESESVFQNCWSRSRFFKTAGVGVGFSKLLESESVFQNCWSRSRNPKKSSHSTTLILTIDGSYRAASYPRFEEPLLYKVDLKLNKTRTHVV